MLNYSGNAFGAGWTLQGLEQIISESGGVILDLGEERPDALVYRQPAAAAEPIPTRPANSRRWSKNSGREATPETLTDGTQITFNSGGHETATIDLNNQHITYAYSGGNLISTITDNYCEHHDLFL